MMRRARPPCHNLRPPRTRATRPAAPPPPPLSPSHLDHYAIDDPQDGATGLGMVIGLYREGQISPPVQLDVPREGVDPGDATRLPPHSAGERSPDKPGLQRAGATGLRKPRCKGRVARVATD